MNVTHSGASRSRDVASARFFLPPSVISAEPSASPYGWKFDLSLRIWTEAGPKGYAAKCVLATLLVSSDERGRTWLGIHAIMKRTGLGSERTVRGALDTLTNDGWIKRTAQTWSSLTAEQLALGRKAPRRGDLGQAPNLYTVLASPRPPVTSEAPTRPGLAQTTANPVEKTPLQKSRGGPLLNDTGGPPAFSHPDPYPLGSVSKEVREEREARSNQGTHLFSKSQDNKGEWAWLDAWNLLVQVHAEKTTAVYGVPPMSPDLKRDQRKEVAECLEGTAVELAAKLRARGIERELGQVTQDLAARVMTLYFKRDNEHLRRVKHALRDLPREFHARITEAMQAILRESHDNVSVPRRTVQLEQPAHENKAEKPAETTKLDSAEKPLSAQVTGSCARQLLETLGATSPKEEPSKAVEVEPTRSEASSPVARSLGRAGAPRWGALPPVPTRSRRVSRLSPELPDEVVESVEPYPRE